MLFVYAIVTMSLSGALMDALKAFEHFDQRGCGFADVLLGDHGPAHGSASASRLSADRRGRLAVCLDGKCARFHSRFRAREKWKARGGSEPSCSVSWDCWQQQVTFE